MFRLLILFGSAILFGCAEPRHGEVGGKLEASDTRIARDTQATVADAGSAKSSPAHTSSPSSRQYSNRNSTVHSINDLDEFQLTSIHNGVRKKLKDPDSAQFGSIGFIQIGEQIYSVCGWVNAKNSFGGYTGSKPYYGILMDHGPEASFLAMSIGGSDVDNRVTVQMCQKNGIFQF